MPGSLAGVVWAFLRASGNRFYQKVLVRQVGEGEERRRHLGWLGGSFERVVDQEEARRAAAEAGAGAGLWG